MAARENVGEIDERVETVQLGGFNDGHRTRAGISAREEPVFSSHSNRAHGSFGRVVVDGHMPVAQEQAALDHPGD